MFFTIFELETTGVSSSDRIVEIALLQIDSAGKTVREYETLVHPGVSISNSGLHGISNEMVQYAPAFGEVLDSIDPFLRDSDLLYAFNLSFQWRMLASAYILAGRPLPETKAECLMSRFRAWAPEAPQKLKGLCEYHKVDPPLSHYALAKTRAIAELLRCYLDQLPQGESKYSRSKLTELPPGPHYSRIKSQEALATTAPILERLTSRLARHSEAAVYDAYFELLDNVFADSVLETREALALFQRAAELGMNPEDTAKAHEAYVQGLLQVAYKDGYYTEMEAEHLEAVAKALKVENVILEKGLETPALYPRDLEEKCICFTGSARGRLQGKPISRSQMIELAQDRGLRVSQEISEELDFLVVGDLKSNSEKIDLARKLGVPLVSEQVFWNWLGVQVL